MTARQTDGTFAITFAGAGTMRSSILCITLLFASIQIEAADKKAKPLNPATAPGAKFVASLDLKEAEVQSVEKRVRILVTGEKQPIFLTGRSCFLIDEWKVSRDSRVTFAENSSLKVGDIIRVVKVGKSTYIVRSKPIEEEEPEEKPAFVPAHDTTPEEVKDVLLLDTKERRDEFELLDGATRQKLLIVAGNIAGIKNVVRVYGDVGGFRADIALHADLFDKKKLRQWLIARGSGATGIIEILKIPDEKHDAVKVEYGWLDIEKHYAMDVARAIANKGISGLNETEKEFVRNNRVLFGRD